MINLMMMIILIIIIMMKGNVFDARILWHSALYWRFSVEFRFIFSSFHYFSPLSPLDHNFLYPVFNQLSTQFASSPELKPRNRHSHDRQHIRIWILPFPAIVQISCLHCFGRGDDFDCCFFYYYIIPISKLGNKQRTMLLAL